MKFSFWFRPDQRWEEVVGLAHHLESTGWDGLWFADHFMSLGDDGHDLLECWAVLAGLAATVPRVRIGSLVSGNTYRHPAVLANTAVTIADMSGGRLVLGIGAGWQRNEHEAYGIDRFDVPGRMSHLDEACRVLRALFTERRATFDGAHYRLADAPLEPKPDPPVPILVGGSGEKVTLRITAELADEWNTWGLPDLMAQKGAVLDRHCATFDRDPSTIRRSAQALVFMSRDPAWVEQRRELAKSPQPTIVGTPAEVVDVMHAYGDAGVDEFIVPQFTLGDRDQSAEFADLWMSEVASAFR